jgi:hypothetical protein
MRMMKMYETHFYGEDVASVIKLMRPEMPDQFWESHPSVVRRMNIILADPDLPVNLRTADAIVTAMGCPHLLIDGTIRVMEGYHRKQEPMVQPLPSEYTVPDVMLPSPPFRKWLERQHRHYATLTSMYIDLDLPMRLGSGIWRGQVKRVRSPIVEAAATRRGSRIELIYPRFRR